MDVFKCPDLNPEKKGMVFSGTLYWAVLGGFLLWLLNTSDKVWSHPVIAYSKFLFISAAIWLILLLLKLFVSKYQQIKG